MLTPIRMLFFPGTVTRSVPSSLNAQLGELAGRPAFDPLATTISARAEPRSRGNGSGRSL